MAEQVPDPVLVVASEAELPPSQRVWGTGAWLPPEQREALDWLTLARLLGWSVTVTRRTRSGLDGSLLDGNRWIIIACHPDLLGEDLVRLLASRLAAEPVLVIARAAGTDAAFARLAGAAARPERVSGRTLHWTGPGGPRNWSTRRDLDAVALKLSEDVSAWAALDGATLIAARRVGRGVVATLGFHPSRARDAGGAVTALLTHLLIWGVGEPVAWLDLAGSLVLRMDDPGGAQNVYLRSWAYPKLGEAQWAAIAGDLGERSARMSIGYVAGWVDDGDDARGLLKVAGRPLRRVGGHVYPSPLVSYEDRAGHAPGTLHDYIGEFRGIRALRAAGAGDVELHGYTHMHPDTARWKDAPDRYEATSWFRELGSAAEATIDARPPHQHPLAIGVSALRGYFDVHPTTLICPGDQWTDRALERALDLGLHLVSNYHLALRHRERFCWTTYVCSPSLSEPHADWFDSGLPVVANFHDRDAVLEGTGWISRWLDAWRNAGAGALIDLRELAAAVGRSVRVEDREGDLRLTVRSGGAPALVRPLRIAIRPVGTRPPAAISVALDDRRFRSPVGSCGDGLVHVVIPSHPDDDAGGAVTPVA